MNTTEAESMAIDHRARNEEQARVVMALLREYSGKLAALTGDLKKLVASGWVNDYDTIAWLLDQSEILRKPLLAILSRGSGLRESAQLDSLIRDELSLRMWETEVHLHHAARLTLALRARLTKSKVMDDVAKMRVSAGLPAIQGGLISTAKAGQ
ncbi:MAG TPA: hypothetical protein VGE74_14295 [Gemmata sp.]